MTFGEALVTLQDLGWYVHVSDNYVELVTYDVWSSIPWTDDCTVQGLRDLLEGELGFDEETYLEEESHQQFNDDGSLNIEAMKTEYAEHVELIERSLKALR